MEENELQKKKPILRQDRNKYTKSNDEKKYSVTTTEQNRSIGTGTAIIVAGFLIAIAIIISNVGKKQDLPAIKKIEDGKQGIVINPVTVEDHLRDNPKAEIVIVEFSDIECPFCKRFHPTMQQIVETYDGRVAWVYRHFPLDSIHPGARIKAEATECANELGGNKAFWQYLDQLMELQPSDASQDFLATLAQNTGLDRINFEECLSSKRFEQKVENDFKDAVAAGARGTPYSVIITSDGTKIPLSGAQSFNNIKAIIDGLL